MRVSLVLANVALLVVVAIFVLNSSGSSATSQASALSSRPDSVTAGALDQLSSAEVAVQVARAAYLPEATEVVNYADSVKLQLTVTPTGDNIVTKPQIVDGGLKSRKDITTYTTVAGDTIDSLAERFKVTSDTIRWSNNLSGNTLPAGKELIISPVNGIVYTIKSGDTVDSITRRYNANKDAFIVFNDIELSAFKPGDKVVIPNGVQPAPAPAPPVYRGFAWGGLSPVYGYNGYGYGYCTWYVANKVGIPANWGNANTWDSGARASGWTLSKKPVAGAIAQTDRMSYLGHVAYVEAVSEDGSQIRYSDMNGISGWGKVGFSGWVPSTMFNWYIYR